MIKNLLIFLILLFATVLRFMSINPGYHSNHADEVNIYTTAITMFKADNFAPFRYEYPPLPAYINLFAYRLFFIPLATLRYDIINFNKVLDGVLPLRMTPLAYTRFLQLEIFGDREINVLFWGRAITALFGVGVVFVFYKIGEKLYNKQVGLLTSFFVAVNYREVFNSHFVLPDIYNVFFLGLAVLLTLRVWKKPSFKNYLIASLACGLSLSTKYQFFSFTPLLLVHVYRIIDAKGFNNRLKVLFDPAALITPFVIGLVFVFLNPYFFIHYDIAGPQLAYVALKYQFGRKILDFFPISYLYHYGLGQAISILTLFGLFFIFVKGIRRALFLYSVLLPFFFITIYYSDGGFYTRNFVSIIPFLLIFPSVLLVEVSKRYFKKLGPILLGVLVILLSYGNIKNDFIVLTNYSNPWNKYTVLTWITKNIPKGSKIAAHSSVPLPDYYFTRLPYDSYPAVSLEELRGEGADWAVTSLDWTTNDFYWWMVQDTVHSLIYWNRPIYTLEQSYGALSIREMQDFGVYSLISSPYAPDSDFLVVHLPVYTVKSKTLEKEFNFEKDGEGWMKKGTTNLLWKDGSLVINMGGTADPFTKWESPVFTINGNGFQMDYKARTDEDETGTLKREGFLFAAFYKSESDANLNKNKVAVRLTPRNDIYNKWINGSLVGTIPVNAHYMKIGFQVYNSALSTVRLSDVKIYSANVQNETIGTKHIDINPDVIFPISQGNL